MSAQPLAVDPEEDEPPLDWRAHPEPDQLERFMRAELPPDERRAVVRHLLTGCPQCRYITGRLWNLGGEKTLATVALLKKKVRLYRRQAREQMPAKPRRGGAAMAALVNAARELLLEITADLAGIYSRLEGIGSALAGPPKRDPEAEDVLEEMRLVIGSVLHECLRSAIGDLRSAAYYPAEPPDEEDEPAAEDDSAS